MILDCRRGFVGLNKVLVVQVAVRTERLNGSLPSEIILLFARKICCCNDNYVGWELVVLLFLFRHDVINPAALS